jgi:hypothetical protein
MLPHIFHNSQFWKRNTRLGNYARHFQGLINCSYLLLPYCFWLCTSLPCHAFIKIACVALPCRTQHSFLAWRSGMPRYQSSALGRKGWGKVGVC